MVSRPSAYGRGSPAIDVAPVPVSQNGVPAGTNSFAFGQLIKNKATGNWYIYSGAGQYGLIVASSGGILSIAGTTHQVTASTVSQVTTLSIPTTFIAPGSIASVTTITAGTGLTVTTGGAAVTGNSAITGSLTASTTLTATLGAITATNGNFVASTAGNGLVLPVNTGSGAASGSVSCNGRQGSVSFTSPSIAAGATQTLTMGNTSITGSSTLVLYSLRGATTGAALNIASVTNSAGSSAVVIENGTGATTQTGTITLDFIVLN